MARYTADEMREMATEAEVIEVADQFYGHDMDTIAAMLRQAADALEQEEREKNYEYAVRWLDGSISSRSSDIKYAQDAEKAINTDRTILVRVVRREVCEWEEVE